MIYQYSSGDFLDSNGKTLEELDDCPFLDWQEDW